MCARRRTRLAGAGFAALAVAALASSASAATRGPRRPELRRELRAAAPLASCRPGRNQLSYHGGDLVQSPKAFALFWGAEWQSDPEHQAALLDLRAMFQQIGSSGYECTMREFALPGKPIGPGSYLGDYVIPSAPVAPGGELSDGTLRARIASEIAAGNAPPPDDDTIYFVVPPKGVPVLSAGETGCGGSNFTFCGYHDAFLSGGQRIRYSALPYPCNANGFTCFVGAVDDPGAALQNVASHELAETITDPDFGPTGASAWYDDATGNENADICASSACNAQLAIGAQSFAVNSLWSNLANACVFDTTCGAPAPSCTGGAPGACVAPRSKTRACAFEWLVAPNLGVDRKLSLPSAKVSCADGQPFCDGDGVADGICTFRVAACVNNHDPRLACAPTAVTGVKLGGKLRASLDPSDQANGAALGAALAAIDPGSAGTFSGAAITYAPPAATGDACTGYVDVAVPAGQKRSYAVSVSTAAGGVAEKLQLTCRASFP